MVKTPKCKSCNGTTQGFNCDVCVGMNLQSIQLHMPAEENTVCQNVQVAMKQNHYAVVNFKFKKRLIIERINQQNFLE